MDAFSVSLANGLKYPKMKREDAVRIASVFAGFQFLMPVIGFLFVKGAEKSFSALQPHIPRIGALILISLGIRMLTEVRHERKYEDMDELALKSVSDSTLFAQGIATSIDALSVGFVIASYSLTEVFSAAFIIGAVTMILCLAGVAIGRRFGMKYASASSILGGIILVLIGIRLLV
ncbi:MAG: manganese efflux pump [Lachnospiraceae bacterium]|nr:manganese efflux pump [Lachnospiraceae bacterium]